MSHTRYNCHTTNNVSPHHKVADGDGGGSAVRGTPGAALGAQATSLAPVLYPLGGLGKIRPKNPSAFAQNGRFWQALGAGKVLEACWRCAWRLPILGALPWLPVIFRHRPLAFGLVPHPCSTNRFARDVTWRHGLAPSSFAALSGGLSRSHPCLREPGDTESFAHARARNTEHSAWTAVEHRPIEDRAAFRADDE